VTEVQLFDAGDAPWIGRVLDVVERSVGEPWRVLLERLEHAQTGASAPKVGAIVRALRRVMGGRAERGRIARKLRELVLGHPALDDAARQVRLEAAASRLGIAPADVELLLWADLRRERPVTLPRGRPDERELAAFANVDRIQSAVARAKLIRIRVWDQHANQLVRTIARYGLAATVSRALDGATVLEVTGPLSLFHATTIYGRAFGAVVPLLAEHRRFSLDICSERDGAHLLRVAPPVLLPPVWTGKRAPSLAERLARDLEKAECVVEREPEPIAIDDDLLFPELAIQHGGERWYVEIVGFSTDEHLAHKLERYRAAGITSIVLALDAARTATEPAPPSTGKVVMFERRVDAGALLATIGESSWVNASSSLGATQTWARTAP
jgi:predicted nuclease of restriction endonuclease-like RecB superfamily